MPLIWHVAILAPPIMRPMSLQTLPTARKQMALHSFPTYLRLHAAKPWPQMTRADGRGSRRRCGTRRRGRARWPPWRGGWPGGRWGRRWRTCPSCAPAPSTCSPPSVAASPPSLSRCLMRFCSRTLGLLTMLAGTACWACLCDIRTPAQDGCQLYPCARAERRGEAAAPGGLQPRLPLSTPRVLRGESPPGPAGQHVESKSIPAACGSCRSSTVRTQMLSLACGSDLSALAPAHNSETLSLSDSLLTPNAQLHAGDY